MRVTVDGTVTVKRPVLANIEALNDTSPLSRINWLREEHFWKAYGPIDWTLEEIETNLRV